MEEIIKSNRNRTGYMGVKEEKEMKEGTRKWRAIRMMFWDIFPKKMLRMF